MKLEEFCTLLYEIAAGLNSRPLTYIYDEVTTTILRPVDLITPQISTGIILVGIYDGPDYVPPQKRKELANIYAGNLASLGTYWKNFHEEYLLSVREKRTTIHNNQRLTVHIKPKVGDIVLVKEADFGRGEWKIGKSAAIKPASGGYIKSATVILPNKRCVERSPALLFPLECNQILLVWFRKFYFVNLDFCRLNLYLLLFPSIIIG